MSYLPHVGGRTCSGAMFAEASKLDRADMEGIARAGHTVLSWLGEGKKNGICQISQRNLLQIIASLTYVLRSLNFFLSCIFHIL